VGRKHQQQGEVEGGEDAAGNKDGGEDLLRLTLGTDVPATRRPRKIPTTLMAAMASRRCLPLRAVAKKAQTYPRKGK
jgi:hypothetical protein